MACFYCFKPVDTPKSQSSCQYSVLFLFRLRLSNFKSCLLNSALFCLYFQIFYTVGAPPPYCWSILPRLRLCHLRPHFIPNAPSYLSKAHLLRLIIMAYKRRLFESGASSRRKQVPRPSATRQRSSSNSHSQTSGISSAPQKMPPPTPVLPVLPSSPRVSLALSSSRASTPPPSGGKTPIQANTLEIDTDVVAREDNDALNETIMAVEMRERGTIGCAYYVAREETLYLVEDIKMASLDIVDTLKLHAQPTVVLISTRSDEKLEEHLSKEARGIDRDDDSSMLPVRPYVTLLI